MDQMMGFGAHGFGWGMGMPLALLAILPVLVLWSLAWKGIALWHSAQRKDVWWFVAFLFINTMGILELVYLFGFAKLKFNELLTSKVHHL